MAAVAAYGAVLATDVAPDADLIARLDAALVTLHATGAITPDARPVVVAMVRANPDRGIALAGWMTEHPTAPLARYAGDVLAVLRGKGHPALPGLLSRLDSGDAAMRRLLALYLASGGWQADPRPQETAWMRQLVRDDDPTIASTIVSALPWLATQDAGLAVELALEAKATSQGSARLVDHVLERAVESLTDSQIEARLAGLIDAHELSWTSWELLRRLGATRPKRVLEMLIERARTSAHGKRAVPYVRSGGDLVEGFDTEEYREALLELVQAARDAEVRSSGSNWATCSGRSTGQRNCGWTSWSARWSTPTRRALTLRPRSFRRWHSRVLMRAAKPNPAGRCYSVEPTSWNAYSRAAPATDAGIAMLSARRCRPS